MVATDPVGLYCQRGESPSIVDLAGAASLLPQSSCSIVDPFVVWLLLLSLPADLLEVIWCITEVAELSTSRAILIPPLVIGVSASHTGFPCSIGAIVSHLILPGSALS